MDLLRIVILAVVQGLTEFLPISSDGHLVVTSTLFEAISGNKLEALLTVEIILHAGTLAAVLVVFRRQIIRLLMVDRRVIGLLVVGTLPAVIVGLPLKKFGKELLQDPLAAGIGLIITGIVLLWGTRPSSTDDETTVVRKSYVDLSYGQAFLIGIFQAAAILPGVSRSGLTIASGLKLAKLNRTDAANFSFLLSIPAVGGAVFLELLDLLKTHTSDSPPTPVGELVFGAVLAFVVGIFALRWLLAWLQAGKFYQFAYWCIPLGVVVTAWQLMLVRGS